MCTYLELMNQVIQVKSVCEINKYMINVMRVNVSPPSTALPEKGPG